MTPLLRNKLGPEITDPVPNEGTRLPRLSFLRHGSAPRFSFLTKARAERTWLALSDDQSIGTDLIQNPFLHGTRCNRRIIGRPVTVPDSVERDRRIDVTIGEAMQE